MAASTTSDYSSPDDISDWIATPSLFSTEKHGPTATFSVGKFVVERLQPDSYPFDCVVYTRDPLVVGHGWQITVLKTTTMWGYGLVSGYVLCFL